jgi:hypothetical protein
MADANSTPPQGGIPPVIDVDTAATVDPSFEVKDGPLVKEPSIPMIGFQLSSFILVIISAFILFLVLFLFFNKTDASSTIKISDKNFSDSATFSRNLELVKVVQSESQNNREFILKISQMILLNLLLPTLTAILGYIFASSNKSKD